MKKTKQRTLFFLLFCGWAITLIALIILITQTGCGSRAELEITCSPSEITAFQGEKVMVTFEIANHLKDSLRPDANYFLSYHLSGEKGNMIAYDNPRFSIPSVLRRQQTTRFTIPVFFGHPVPGDYNIEFDIVKEGEFWGSTRKWITAKVKLRLKSLFSPDFKDKYLGFFRATGNPLLDQEQYLLRLTLKNSEMVTEEGKLFGFSAGSDYPQVWIRDTATFIAYTKLFYPLDSLASGVELFFQHQSGEGEIVDWVDISGNTDKMTVETDQESSLVLAAFEIGNDFPQWFDKTIGGKTVLERLESALEWVWRQKRLAGSDLICSGFTADWGDTENTYPDQRATKLSDRSTLVYSTYTQAKYIQAIDRLLNILDRTRKPGFKEKTRVWQERRDSLKSQTRKLLYLEDRGYFISHRVAVERNGGKDSEPFFAMEKEMLAVGGNAEAIIAGLMDQDQVKRFLEVLADRRKQYNLRTVSFTLIPPYPEGFFPHHLLRQPWSYQNGGEWDWIGGRVVKALFMTGFKNEARQYLLEIVKKNLANFCIYEWEDRQGTGRGAMFYVGAAGVLGEVVLLYASGGPTAWGAY